MLAERLSHNGHKVVVYEKEKQLGGLATYHNYGPFTWDRFYHVILPSDQVLIEYLKDLGLGSVLRWNQTFTGFYVDHKYYSMSNSIEFLRFPLLNLVDKIRLAFTILYCSRLNDWKRLEKIPLDEWLIRIGGKKTFEKLWKPLLLAKLGENYRQVSAVFIWSYIKRLFSARDTSAQKEQLGYIQGGYKTVFDRIAHLIQSRDGIIHTGVAVEKIDSEDSHLVVCQHDKRETFDKVIATSPDSVLKRIADKNLVNFFNDRNEIDYLGVVCMVVVSYKSFTPYYILNIADKNIPFTGVIGMSTIVPLAETGGRYITYFPKYVSSTDPIWSQGDEKVKDIFYTGFRKMYPDFDEKSIESIHINRAFRVQPLQVLNYSEMVPKIKTEHKDFFVVNSSQFVSDTLNNNTVATQVNKFLKETSFICEKSIKLKHEYHSQLEN